MLLGGVVARFAFRRLVLHRRHLDRHLLPTELSGENAHAGSCALLPSAAAAQLAGFRACKRCRPNATPGSPEWDARADVVARAMRLIADGLVDRPGTALAAQLGYSVRQLERLLMAEVGAGPIALARAQRAQTARVLIETTPLPMADVAFAAGFASIRQFNDTVDPSSPAPPPRSARVSAIAAIHRRVGSTSSSTGPPSPVPSAALSRQPVRPPGRYRHPGDRGGVRGSTYRRTLRLAHGPGIVELTPTPDSSICRALLS